MLGLPLISVISLGLPTTRQDFGLISIKDCGTAWLKMVFKTWLRLDMFFFPPLTRMGLAICSSSFRTLWLHEYRKPDLFLTISANGSWPEITQNPLLGLLLIYYI